MSNRIQTCRACGIEYLTTSVPSHEICPGCRALNELTRGTGTIRWFDRRRGYGFLRSETGQDIFFHHTDLRLPLSKARPHALVAFLIEQTDRGIQARQLYLRESS